MCLTYKIFNSVPSKHITFRHTIGPKPPMSVKCRYRQGSVGKVSITGRQLKLWNLLFQQPVTVIGPLSVIYRQAIFAGKWRRADVSVLIMAQSDLPTLVQIRKFFSLNRFFFFSQFYLSLYFDSRCIFHVFY